MFAAFQTFLDGPTEASFHHAQEEQRDLQRREET